MTRKQKFFKYLQTIPRDTFAQMCFDIARSPENWSRVEAVCAVDLLDEFNNDAIDAFREAWESMNPESDEDED